MLSIIEVRGFLGEEPVPSFRRVGTWELRLGHRAWQQVLSHLGSPLAWFLSGDRHITLPIESEMIATSSLVIFYHCLSLPKSLVVYVIMAKVLPLFSYCW